MRLLVTALCVAFSLSGAAWAGEGCGWGSNSTVKKNDFETPPIVIQEQQKDIKS